MVIVGAGPAGLLAAIFLANSGCNVHVRVYFGAQKFCCPQWWLLTSCMSPEQVYEKREEQLKGAQPPRSLFYGLSGRGQSALRAVSLKQVRCTDKSKL